MGLGTFKGGQGYWGMYVCMYVCMYIHIDRGFPKLGVPFWGSNNKGYSILGLHWSPPLYGEITMYIYIYVYNICRASGFRV